MFDNIILDFGLPIFTRNCSFLTAGYGNNSLYRHTVKIYAFAMSLKHSECIQTGTLMRYKMS